MSSMNKMPPNSPDVERSVLGSLLCEPGIIGQVVEKLPSEAFYGHGNRLIFETIVDMYDNDKTPDIVTLAERLRQDGNIEKCGTEVYLSELTEEISTSPNVSPWIDILNSHATRRKIITYCQMIENQAFRANVKTESLVKQLDQANEQTISFCEDHGVRHRRRGAILRVNDVWESVVNHYEKGEVLEGTGISCWPEFSKRFRFVPGFVNIVGGITNHGKSTLMEQIVQDTILQGKKWAVFSPENMPHYRQIQPIVQKYLGKNFFGKNKMSLTELNHMKEKLNDSIFYLEPNEHNRDVKEIKRLMKVAYEEHGVDAILIDPWNKILHRRPKGQHETDYNQEQMTEIQFFTRQSGICLFNVVHPTKMERKPGQKKDDVPTIQHLKGGSWGNAVDMVITGYRHYNLEDENQGWFEVHHQKVKFIPSCGKPGVTYMRYNPIDTRLYEITKDQAKGETTAEDFQITEPDEKQGELWQDQF